MNWVRLYLLAAAALTLIASELTYVLLRPGRPKPLLPHLLPTFPRSTNDEHH